MKLATLVLILCTSCSRVIVPTAGGGYAEVYGQKIENYKPPEYQYANDRPDVPYTYNEYGYCKTYIK